MAYLCLINNPADNLRLQRIINEPKRGIGTETVRAIDDIANYEHLSNFEVVCNADIYPGLNDNTTKKLLGFASIMNELIEKSHEMGIADLIKAILSTTEYEASLLNDEKSEDKLSNINMLVSYAKTYEENYSDCTLEDFLADASLMSEMDHYDSESNAVVLMTIHSAKGMEFNTVFVPAMEQGHFPSQQSAYKNSELEEERRLCYVATTRAKQKLFFTFAHERMYRGQTEYNPPSSFLRDIKDDDKINEVIVRQRVSYTPSERLTDFEIFKQKQAGATIQQTTSTPTPKALIFNVGERVSHLVFGEGEVLSSLSMGGDVMYEIAFDSVGTKKLMGKYAKLRKIT